MRVVPSGGIRASVPGVALVEDMSVLRVESSVVAGSLHPCRPCLSRFPLAVLQMAPARLQSARARRSPSVGQAGQTCLADHRVLRWCILDIVERQRVGAMLQIL